MKHRILLLVVVLCLFAPSRPASAAAPATRPNILFIFSDDHATNAIGAYGSRINQTPNLDRLAREGMLFRNCLVTNSVCTPSRATILTGKFSHLNDTYNVGDRFDARQQSFPRLLQQAGYQTALIGKWHLGHGGASDPVGFDYWNVLVNQGPYYNPPMIENGVRSRHTGYTTDIITNLSLAWLKEKRDPNKPFMLMYQHKSPHRPWDPDPKYFPLYDDKDVPEPANLFDDYANRASPARTQEMQISRDLNDRDLKLDKGQPGLTPDQRKAWDAYYDPIKKSFAEAKLAGKDLVRWKYQRYMKDYLRCVASMDDNIGRVLKYLDESGLAQNTVVIYSSDQGFYLGEHGWFDKRFMYEESLKQPLLVRWPNTIKPNSESAALVSNLDFAQTFLDLAGAPQPPDMQGRSLVPLLKGESPPDRRKAVYYHFYDFPADHNVQRHYGVRTDRHKLIYYYDVKEWELFDLQTDPHEMRNAYDDPAYAQTRADLQTELKRLQSEYKDTDPELSLAEIGQRNMRRQASGWKTERLDVSAEPSPSLAGAPFAFGATITPTAPNGVIASQGGKASGWSLFLRDGRPTFALRNGRRLTEVSAPDPIPLNQPTHVVAQLSPDGALRLLLNTKPVAEKPAEFLERLAAEPFTLADDPDSPVAPYTGPTQFPGDVTTPRLYRGSPDNAELNAWSKQQ